MATNCDPGWPKNKRTKFDSGKAESTSEDDETTLPGVTFLSDLLKVIDGKRQTGYTDTDLPQPFGMRKSYAHVPHEHLAPDGFPKSDSWLNPACRFAVLSPINPNEGLGGLVPLALDLYREQGKPGVPDKPTKTVKLKGKAAPRHPARAKRNLATKATAQSANSANRLNKKHDCERYRLNDPVLPYEDYDRTMEIIFNCYKIVTHGKGQFIDRDSHELIFTYSFEDLESMTPEERQEHQEDVSTILMSTKLFKRLPTPKPLTPPVFRSKPITSPMVPPAFPPNTILTDHSKKIFTYDSILPSSPSTSLPPSDAEDEEDSVHTHTDLHQSTSIQASQFGEPVWTTRSSSPLTLLPPSDAEEEVTRTIRKRKGHQRESICKKAKVETQEVSNGQSEVPSKKRKRAVTTNGALVHGRMHCFGQTVGYSRDILHSVYLPAKGSSLSLYRKFLDRLPALGAHIGGRFKGFCDEGFTVARQLLNLLRAPPMASTSKSQPSGPLDFAANFAFTFGNFYNKPHTDNDKGEVYCLWYPIDSLSGQIVTQSEGFDLEGGWFIFPEYRVAIHFGCQSAVQIAWNGKTRLHHTIPSKEYIQLNKQGKQVHYTRLGCSSQTTYKIVRASVKIGTDEQFNDTSNCERKVRDVDDILELPDRNWKE